MISILCDIMMLNGSLSINELSSFLAVESLFAKFATSFSVDVCRKIDTFRIKTLSL